MYNNAGATKWTKLKPYKERKKSLEYYNNNSKSLMVNHN